MPKKCERQQPTFRVNMHLPATSWHPHTDKTFQVKGKTEFEAWAFTMRDILVALTHRNQRLMVGYWADVLNALPSDIRRTLVAVIAQGLGLDIRPAPDDPQTIEIHLVPRYEALVGDQKTESGLVIPGKGGKSPLTLPSDPRYNERS
jgi:hypothetical protein